VRPLLVGGLVAIAVGVLGIAGTGIAMNATGYNHIGTWSGMTRGDPGQMMGQMMSGTAPEYVGQAQARSLGEQIPTGATINKAHNRLILHGQNVHLVVLASPEGGPDMAFRIAGLTNPVVAVPTGAAVTVQFINGDTDTSHGWELANRQESFAYMPMMGSSLALPGSSAMPLGIPSKDGWPAETISFSVNSPGTYTYLCPVPGHAQKGMHGEFLVG